MNYFYLVVAELDESTYVKKIFLNKQNAIRYGRRLATKFSKVDRDFVSFALYQQPITANGELHYVQALEPYKGADFDIDIVR